MGSTPDYRYTKTCSFPATLSFEQKCKEEFGPEWTYSGESKMDCWTNLEYRPQCVRQYDNKSKRDCCLQDPEGDYTSEYQKIVDQALSKNPFIGPIKLGSSIEKLMAYKPKNIRQIRALIKQKQKKEQFTPLNQCHPKWKDMSDCDDVFKVEIANYLRQGLPLTKRMEEWVAKHAKDYEIIKNSACPNTYTGPTTICGDYCNKYPDKCSRARAEYCAKDNNIIKQECQMFKTIDPIKQRATYWDAEYRYCQSSEDKMKSQQCINFSRQEGILGTPIKESYDIWWQKYCDRNSSAKECACHVPHGTPMNTPLANPQCFKPECVSRDDVYRNTTLLTDKRPCPNVCMSVIEASAGGTAIINNVTVIQECFGTGDSKVKEKIKEAIQLEIEENVKTLDMLLSVTGQSQTNSEYTTIHENLNYIEKNIPEYEDIKDYPKYTSIITSLKFLSAKIPEATKNHNDLLSFDWSVKNPAEAYTALKAEFGNTLLGVRGSLKVIKEDINSTLDYVEMLKKERKSMIEKSQLSYDEYKKYVDELRNKYNKILGASNTTNKERLLKYKNLFDKADEIKYDTVERLKILKSNRAIKNSSDAYLKSIDNMRNNLIDLETLIEEIEVDPTTSIDTEYEKTMNIKNLMGEHNNQLNTKLDKLNDAYNDKKGIQGEEHEIYVERYQNLMIKVIEYKKKYGSFTGSEEEFKELLKLKAEIVKVIDELLPKFQSSVDKSKTTVDPTSQTQKVDNGSHISNDIWIWILLLVFILIIGGFIVYNIRK